MTNEERARQYAESFARVHGVISQENIEELYRAHLAVLEQASKEREHGRNSGL